MPKLNLCVTKITLNYANGLNSWLVINDLPYNRKIVQLLVTCVVRYLFSLISLNSVYVYCLDIRLRLIDAISNRRPMADAHHHGKVDSERHPFLVLKVDK